MTMFLFEAIALLVTVIFHCHINSETLSNYVQNSSNCYRLLKSMMKIMLASYPNGEVCVAFMCLLGITFWCVTKTGYKLPSIGKLSRHDLHVVYMQI